MRFGVYLFVWRMAGMLILAIGASELMKYWQPMTYYTHILPLWLAWIVFIIGLILFTSVDAVSQTIRKEVTK